MFAKDFLTDKMPSEWGNIAREGRDGRLKFDYSATTSILWSALQHTLKENDEMNDLVKAMKRNGYPERGNN